jgi:endoglucanase
MWQSAETFPQLRFPGNDANLILSFHFYTPMALTHHTAPWTAIGEYAGPVNYPGQIVDTVHYRDMPASVAKAMRAFANGYFTKERLEERILPAIRVAQARHLQLYCGEYGVFPTIPEGPMLRYYSDLCEIFRKNGIAYCHWCYKGDFPVLKSDGTPKLQLVSILTSH